MQEHRYGRLFRTARSFWNLFGGKSYQIIGTLPEDSVVYVGHHHNLRGPLCVMRRFPKPVRVWALYVFCDQKSCFDQYYGYTLTQRLHWPKPVAYVCAKLFAAIVNKLMGSMGAIPVYRGTTHLRKTLQLSLEALNNGQSLVIFPDVDYSSNDPEMGDIYSGFLGLERFYYKQTGKHLGFVPFGVDTRKHRFTVGQPLYFNDTQPFAAQKDGLAERLRSDVNRLNTMR